jgi:hypothetical protein
LYSDGSFNLTELYNLPIEKIDEIQKLIIDRNEKKAEAMKGNTRTTF